MTERRNPGEAHEGDAAGATAIEYPRGLLPVPEFDERSLQLQLEQAEELTARADRRNTRGKMLAGIRGLKHAIRGDSSFFAHFYRGTLIAITASMLGVNQWCWCLLILGACLVLIAELSHSAVDTLARAIGNPEEPRLCMAREIAAAGVLVAAFGSGGVTAIVLSWKLAQLMGWVL
ncbi:Prokaryotic diacylglycerol kinase [Aquisphaera giovannonii]|uniref:Prokaryotic diacylglycerol kinase n=1 Tax=Aquisphaera giovannonii TaxID=406548 RepID=A0A5B9W842_9BACT|nr:diacylglycerol kinase [Aquisphaera giovannonii]QEH36309.1 Prokaryotic diacylglycerol kinase [Aquisphaera giovannonii]